MAKKYLDENGLAYFWSKVKQYLATPTRAGLMSPTDKAKVDAITNQGTIAYYRKLEGSYTTISTGEDTIPIPITSYSTADILLVDINGLDLVEGVDYTVSGTNIVLTTPISIIGQAVHFIALRATTAASADYSILKGDDGDVSDVLVDGNSVVNQQGIANISIQSLGLIDVFYPVGSYYETSDTTFDPNNTWGGTWVLETEGVVHVSAGTSYAVNHANDNSGVGAKDGGASTVTLTSAQSAMPSHHHGLNNHVHSLANHTHGIGRALGVNTGTWSGDSASAISGSGHKYGYVADSGTTIQTITATGGNNGNTGGNSGDTTDSSVATASQAHENMPPYINVNRWHRTA